MARRFRIIARLNRLFQRPDASTLNLKTLYAGLFVAVVTAIGGCKATDRTEEAQEISPVETTVQPDPLDTVIPVISVHGEDVESFLSLVSDFTGIVIRNTREVRGQVSVEMKDATVGMLLDMVLNTNGWAYEVIDESEILVMTQEQYKNRGHRPPPVPGKAKAIAALSKKVDHISFRREDIRDCAARLSKIFGVRIECKDKVQGKVHLEGHNLTLRTVLEMIVQGRDWWYEVTPVSSIVIMTTEEM